MSPVPLESSQLLAQTATAVADCKESVHESDALDEALVESFPASDPVAVSVTRIAVGT